MRAEREVIAEVTVRVLDRSWEGDRRGEAGERAVDACERGFQ